MTITTRGPEQALLAFNDVSIARRPGTGVVMADLAVDGTAYGYFKADAIVIPTTRRPDRRPTTTRQAGRCSPPPSPPPS